MSAKGLNEEGKSGNPRKSNPDSLNTSSHRLKNVFVLPLLTSENAGGVGQVQIRRESGNLAGVCLGIDERPRRFGRVGRKKKKENGAERSLGRRKRLWTMNCPGRGRPY